MTPSGSHENGTTLLARLIEAMTEELDIPIDTGGSTTFERPDSAKGFEPDESWWIQNEAALRDELSPNG